MVTLDAIKAARRRIQDAVKKTPLSPSSALSERVGAEVALKLESRQRTGSFKERGALNKLLCMTDEERARGVVAASAGNHAQAVAYHATTLGVRSTILMPEGTPLIKVTRTAAFGGEVILRGANYDESLAAALALAEERGASYVHAYDDDDVIAGQGTVALELVEQDPFLDVVIIPVGGGGMVAGMATAIKAINPKIRVVGVEVAGQEAMRAAVSADAPVLLDARVTIADGIAVRKVGVRTREACVTAVDDFVSVTDAEVAEAILYLLEQEKLVAEGAGAVPVAALLHERIPGLEGKRVAAVISGGNIDVTMIGRIIRRGLAESGRIVSMRVVLKDRPGGLAALLSAIAEKGVNVLQVTHERTFSAGFGEADVALRLETKGPAHLDELWEHLAALGYDAAMRY